MFISANSAIIALYLWTYSFSALISNQHANGSGFISRLIGRLPFKRQSKNDEVDVIEYPGMVSFETANPSARICAGFIVDKFTVVTAAHCLFNLNSSNTKFGLTFIKQLTAGTKYRVDTLSEVNQKYVRTFTGSDFLLYIHPRYFKDAQNNDIAVLKKRTPFSFTNKLSSIAPDFNYPKITKEGNRLYMVGFGKKNGSSDFVLKQRHVPAGYKNSPGNGIIHLQSEDVCIFQDNSGAPLLEKKKRKKVAIGVATASESCSGSGDAKFTMFHEHANFVQELLGSDFHSCGEIDAVKHNDFLDPNLYTTKYPWLMALFDKNNKFLCHGTYVGNNTLISASDCFYEEDGGRPHVIGSIASTVEMLANDDAEVQPLLLRQFGPWPYKLKAKADFVIIKMNFDMQKHFYLRSLCLLQPNSPATKSTPLLIEAGFFQRRNRKTFGLHERKLEMVENTLRFDSLLCASEVEHRPDLVLGPDGLGQPLMSVRAGHFYLEGIQRERQEDKGCPSIYYATGNLNLD